MMEATSLDSAAAAADEDAIRSSFSLCACLQRDNVINDNKNYNKRKKNLLCANIRNDWWGRQRPILIYIVRHKAPLLLSRDRKGNQMLAICRFHGQLGNSAQASGAVPTRHVWTAVVEQKGGGD